MKIISFSATFTVSAVLVSGFAVAKAPQSNNWPPLSAEELVVDADGGIDIPLSMEMFSATVAEGPEAPAETPAIEPVIEPAETVPVAAAPVAPVTEPVLVAAVIEQPVKVATDSSQNSEVTFEETSLTLIPAPVKPVTAEVAAAPVLKTETTDQVSDKPVIAKTELPAAPELPSKPEVTILAEEIAPLQPMSVPAEAEKETTEVAALPEAEAAVPAEVTPELVSSVEEPALPEEQEVAEAVTENPVLPEGEEVVKAADETPVLPAAESMAEASNAATVQPEQIAATEGAKAPAVINEAVAEAEPATPSLEQPVKLVEANAETEAAEPVSDEVFKAVVEAMKPKEPPAPVTGNRFTFYMSDAVAFAQVERSTDKWKLDNGRMHVAALLSEERDSVVHAGVSLDSTFTKSFRLSFGGRVYIALLGMENVDAFAGAIGGEAAYRLPFEATPLEFAASLYYAPDIFTFGAGDRAIDAQADVILHFRENSALFAGVRFFQVDVRPEDREVDNRLHLGFRWDFK